MLSRKELGEVLAVTNKMRNDWGHGGVVSQAEAQDRNVQLVNQLQKFRHGMADGWVDVQLMRALQCRPRRGVFENEVEI